jgi:myosin heavy subunit
VRPKLHSATSFALVHYAGEVCYDVRGFSRKNFESLGPDVQDVPGEHRQEGCGPAQEHSHQV